MSFFKSAVLLAATLAVASAFAQTPVGPRGVITDGSVSPATANGYLIDGNSIPNGNFTIATNGTLQLGLRARVRGNVQTMDTGLDSGGTGTYGPFSASAGPDALWNFDFSVNTNATGKGGSNLSASGYTFYLGMDYNPAGGGVASYYVLNLSTGCLDSQFGNQSTNGSAGTTADCSAAPAAATSYSSLLANNNVMDNSENLGFFAANFPGGFDASAPGEYSFFLQAVANNQVVAETDIRVTVPEPASLALMGVGLAGLAVASRRRKVRRQA